MGMKPRARPQKAGGAAVDSYIAGLAPSRAATVQALRELIKEAAPSASEAIKWAQPVFESDGPFAYIKAFGGHVNLGFWRGTELTDPTGVLEGTGGRMRHIKVTDQGEIDGNALRALVRQAVDLNASQGNPTLRRK